MSIVVSATGLTRYYSVGRGVFARPATLKALDGASFTLERGSLDGWGGSQGRIVRLKRLAHNLRTAYDKRAAPRRTRGTSAREAATRGVHGSGSAERAADCAT